MTGRLVLGEEGIPEDISLNCPEFSGLEAVLHKVLVEISFL